jgi:hypothetical protein
MHALPRAAASIASHLRVHWAIWALWALAALWIAWFALRVHVYFVMPDELRYVKQAVSWGSGHPVVPGTETWVTASQLEPILIAPVWALLSSWRAYQLTHVETSLLFASAAFPAYLLARDVVRSHGWALVAAGLSVVVPWSVMAGVVMLENTAYPLALWALLAVHRAAVRPSRRADLIALGALALAYLARSELLILWAALPAVLVVQGLRYPAASIERTRRVRAVVETHWPVFALGALVVLAGALDRRYLIGDSPQGGKFGIESFAFGREMLIYVAVGVGMLPLALSITWVLATLLRPLSPERHAYAVILLAAVLPMAVVVGGGSRVFAPDQLRGVNDRYLFYAAPLLIIGMLAFLLERRPLTLTTLAGGALAAWMAWASHLLLAGATFITPTATYHPELNHYAERVGGWLGADHFTSGRLAALVTAIACVAIALARRRVRPPVLATVVVALVGLYTVNETQYTRHRLTDIQPAADYGRGRNWVDRALPRGTSAAVLLSSLGVNGADSQATWWDLTFWNKKAAADRYAFSSRVFWDGQAVPHALTVDTRAGRIGGFGNLHYLVRGVADRRFGFVDETRVGAPHNNLQLWQLPSAGRLQWWFHGLDDTGYIPPGREGRLRVFGAGSPGPRTVTIPLGLPFGGETRCSYLLFEGARSLIDARRVGTVGSGGARASLSLTPPANGFTELRIATGRGCGLQFYGANVSR